MVPSKCQQLRLFWSSLVAQQVKDLALSLIWHGFDPWLGNLRMLQMWPKNKLIKKKKEKTIFTLRPDLVALCNTICGLELTINIHMVEGGSEENINHCDL